MDLTTDFKEFVELLNKHEVRSGLQVAESWEARNIVLTAGQLVSFVSLSELIRSKVAAGRPQDLADVDHLRNRCTEH